jgi:hypothetical protein
MRLFRDQKLQHNPIQGKPQIQVQAQVSANLTGHNGSSTQNLLSQNQAMQDDLLVAKVELKTYKTLHAESKTACADAKAACADAKAACAGIKANNAAMKAEHLKMQAERKEMKAEHKQMKAEHEKMMAEHAAINAELDPYDTRSASGLPVVDKYDGTYVSPDVMGDAESPLEPSPDLYQDLPSPERSRTQFGEMYVGSEDPYRAPDPYEVSQGHHHLSLECLLIQASSAALPPLWVWPKPDSQSSRDFESAVESSPSTYYDSWSQESQKFLCAIPGVVKFP